MAEGQTLVEVLWREKGKVRALIFVNECMRDLGSFSGLGTLSASL